MSRLSRRGFLKTSLAVAGGASLLNGCSSAGGGLKRAAGPATRVRGANERIRVVVAGVNGRGVAHLDTFTVMPNVQVVSVIDPDSRLFSSRIRLVEEKGHNTPKAVQDIRRVLDDKDVDVVSVATPNHWHSLMTIWACQAGKDVYVEKPLSHSIHEGRIAVETARKYSRIVQHGTGTRSNLGRAQTLAVIASGKLGKLLVSRGLCYKAGDPGKQNTRGDIGFCPPKAPPTELDFSIWLGPAREQPYHENLVHYRWHWFWDFGNGDIGNQGVHEMDVARWAIPGATLPKSVVSFGGRFGPKDQGQTANEQIAIFDYGETQLIFEVRGLPSAALHGQDVGNIYHLEAGTIYGADFYPKGSKEPSPLPDVEAKRGPGEDNFANFIAAVRSRKVADLNADVEEGHYSAALCHLANMSYRLGEQVPFNPQTKAFGDNKEAYETLARMEEHLAKENGFKLDGMKYQLGRKLTVDAAKERIVGDDQANAMLTRDYRKPFVVPDKVV
jgi:predicted dehydrogenase